MNARGQDDPAKSNARHSSVKSVLIIKLGALGDVAMATAMLPALRKLYPDIHITWMAGQGASTLLSLLAAPPQRIITIDERKLFHGSPITRLREIMKANVSIGGKKFDLGLVPYRDKRYHLLHAAAKCALLRDFSSPKALLPGIYQPQEYTQLALGNNTEAAPEISFPRITLPLSSRQKKTPAILLAPGGAKNALADSDLRRWPLSHYATLAKMLIATDHSVGLIGNAEDAWTLPAFDGIPVISHIGATNLTQLLELLRSSQILITHDTGPMHLMRLLDGKILALFGPTRSSEFMIPDARRIVLTTSFKLPCQPCYDGKKYALCQKNICLSAITPETVFETLQANFDLR